MQEATSEDVEMSRAEGNMTDHLDESYNESAAVPGSSPTRAGGVPAQLASTPPAGPQQSEPAVPKRKMKITHDRYLQLQSLVILHLSEHERETEKGMDREELVDWYLESRENDFQTVEELEYEKELFHKVLRKLVKVSADPSNVKGKN